MRLTPGDSCGQPVEHQPEGCVCSEVPEMDKMEPLCSDPLLQDERGSSCFKLVILVSILRKDIDT